MADSTVTREAFPDRVIEIVRARFPLVKITHGHEGAFAVTVNGSLAPLENLYRAAVLRPDDMQHQIERWAVELLRAAEGAPDAVAGFEEVRERILPMVLPNNSDNAYAGVVQEPLVEGLIVAFAIDHDRTISYLSQQRFEEWKVPLDTLRETALNNLMARSEQIAAHAAQDEDGQVNLILFQTMDGYDASRVLLPNLHDRLREHLGSPFLAGLPNRDILICFRDDPQTIERLAHQIGEDYRRMPHQITDKLLLITADGIALR
jgi:hypothetical protein